MTGDALEQWPAEEIGSPALVVRKRSRLAWKTLLLLATTAAFIPILLWRDELAGTLYVGALAAVHVAGLAVFVWGIRRHDIAPTRRGFWVRLLALAVLLVLLSFAAGGLKAGAESIVFWLSLAAVWLLHTGGLLLVHVRTRREILACPYA